MKRAGVLVLVLAIAGFMTGVAFAEEAAPIPVSVEIAPDSAEVAVDDELEFEAAVLDSSGNEIDAAVAWAVSDSLVGAVNEKGEFIAKKAGSVLVIATVGALADTAKVTVTAKSPEEPPVDLTQPSVTFYRVNPAGHLEKQGGPVNTGGTITLGGMGYPFNFLNGMKLTFPDSSLTETICITYEIPKFAKIGPDSVSFENQIVNGVTFRVYRGSTVVKDSLVAGSYTFGKPVAVTLPYKRGLLINLGIKPEDIGMYFADDQGNIYEGIAHTSLDSTSNMITGQAPHFSTVVIAPKSAAPVAVKEKAPAAFGLAQNVPNPFNPATTISFAVPTSGLVKLAVYNVLGQEVRTLVNGSLAAGSYNTVWNGRDEMGRAVTSGVYFYRLEAGSLTATKKLMLLR